MPDPSPYYDHGDIITILGNYETGGHVGPSADTENVSLPKKEL